MIACTRKMPTSISEDGPQLSAEGNFHQHINVFLVLERLVQPEKESFRRGKQKNSIIWWTLDISPCWKVWGVWVISCFENDVDWEGWEAAPPFQIESCINCYTLLSPDTKLLNMLLSSCDKTFAGTLPSLISLSYRGREIDDDQFRIDQMINFALACNFGYLPFSYRLNSKLIFRVPF